ncbi:PREDICTED: E3 ubiquitin-protein ligase SMURF2 [Papilio polytes]|uniref:E3 ubiquitin-protein ligase SMURF2 n=1 Tax=Papilio polytes TaxID=76194 RepID=UPI00067657E3|nr:PREDICTED: E3 ubiquitin-protein ligase SMURF2 [Papilio polytes]
MSTPVSNRKYGAQKIRLTILCARNLVRRDLFRLPDPFVKISVDGSGQVYSTNAVKATLDPKWNTHYDLYLSKGDGITISVWNQRKVHKRQGSGFLGCVRIQPSTVHKLKDTGYQCLELCEENLGKACGVRGQVIVSLLSRDSTRGEPASAAGEGSPLAVVGPAGEVRAPRDPPINNTNASHLPLPPHWEERFTSSGRPYYVNHALRRTQWERPTSEELSPVTTQPSSPSLPSPACPTSPTAPISPSSPMSPSLPSSPASPSSPVTETEVSLVTSISLRPEPQPQTAVRSPQVQNPSTPTSPSTTPSPTIPIAATDLPPGYEMRTTAQGQVYFYNGATGLQALQPQTGHCRIEVSRNEVLEESYRLVMKLRGKELRKRLLVKFRGEEGLDYGGVAREWLHLLGRELFNPHYGLFQYASAGDDRYALQINPDSGVNPEHLSYFHFAGRILGVALFHGHQLDAAFTAPFYKQLLGRAITLRDIRDVDPELHRSLSWMLENSIAGVIDTTFSVECASFGAVRSVELRAGGAAEVVTDTNKRDYVRLYVAHRFTRGAERQWLALQRGLADILFTLHLVADASPDSLPKAHTCFNRLDIPPYPNKEKMHDKLKQAVLETAGFAVE